MKRLTPLSLLLLLLLSLACVTAPCPRTPHPRPDDPAPPTGTTRGVFSAVQVDREKVVLVELKGTTVTVTPWRVRLESPDQEVIWVASDPAWQIDIEFKQNALAKPCPAPAPRCGKRFRAGRPGVYEYDVIVIKSPKETYRVDPELEIRY